MTLPDCQKAHDVWPYANRLDDVPTCLIDSEHLGKLTIGVGRNLDDRGLSADEIDVLLANDITIARAGCRALFPAFDGFNSKRQAGLISMAFNLGQTRLAGFRRMRAAINDGNWTGASTEALDSYWAGQVGRRASEIAALLRSSEQAL